MGARQALQRPRSSSQLRTGTLSAGRIGVPQAGQAEPGLTTERRSGTRGMTTLAKEPDSMPNRAAATAANTVMSVTLPRPPGLVRAPGGSVGRLPAAAVAGDRRVACGCVRALQIPGPAVGPARHVLDGERAARGRHRDHADELLGRGGRDVP